MLNEVKNTPLLSENVNAMKHLSGECNSNEQYPPLSDILPYCIVAEEIGLQYFKYKAVQNWRSFVEELLTYIDDPEQFTFIVHNKIEAFSSEEYDEYKRYIINYQNLGNQLCRKQKISNPVTHAILNWNNYDPKTNSYK